MENYPSAEHWWRRLVPKIFEEAFGLKGLEAAPACHGKEEPKEVALRTHAGGKL